MRITSALMPGEGNSREEGCVTLNTYDFLYLLTLHTEHMLLNTFSNVWHTPSLKGQYYFLYLYRICRFQFSAARLLGVCCLSLKSHEFCYELFFVVVFYR